MLKYIYLSALTISSICQFTAASAAAITNGNFDSDLTGWSIVSNGGTVQWDATGKANLSTSSGAIPFSAVLIQGDDGLFTFNSPLSLLEKDDLFKFNATFSTIAVDPNENPVSDYSDNLQVWLYDANPVSSSSDLLIAKLDLQTGGSSFSVNLTPFIGHSVAFSFELNDENDGYDSQVLLDSIRIESNPVPLPGALGSMLLAFISWFSLRINTTRFKK